MRPAVVEDLVGRDRAAGVSQREGGDHRGEGARHDEGHRELDEIPAKDEVLEAVMGVPSVPRRCTACSTRYGRPGVGQERPTAAAASGSTWSLSAPTTTSRPGQARTRGPGRRRPGSPAPGRRRRPRSRRLLRVGGDQVDPVAEVEQRHHAGVRQPDRDGDQPGCPAVSAGPTRRTSVIGSPPRSGAASSRPTRSVATPAGAERAGTAPPRGRRARSPRRQAGRGRRPDRHRVGRRARRRPAARQHRDRGQQRGERPAPAQDGAAYRSEGSERAGRAPRAASADARRAAPRCRAPQAASGRRREVRAPVSWRRSAAFVLRPSTLGASAESASSRGWRSWTRSSSRSSPPRPADLPTERLSVR